MSQITDINTQLSEDNNANEDEIFAFLPKKWNKVYKEIKKQKFLRTILEPDSGALKLLQFGYKVYIYQNIVCPKKTENQTGKNHIQKIHK